MATSKPGHLITHNRHFGVWFIGLLLALLLGCKTASPPEAVAIDFWQALADNDIDEAYQYASKTSIPFVRPDNLPDLQNASLKSGQIVINDTKATIDTLISTNPTAVITVKTFLVKEDQHWKVNVPRTFANLQQAKAPFTDFFNNLESIGNTLNQQLEQGLTIFGEELKKQVDEFGRELQKQLPKKPAPTDGSI